MLKDVFVLRYKDKNCYDNRGRRIHYNVSGNEVTKMKRKTSLFSDDYYSDSDYYRSDGEEELAGRGGDSSDCYR